MHGSQSFIIITPSTQYISHFFLLETHLLLPLNKAGSHTKNDILKNRTMPWHTNYFPLHTILKPSLLPDWDFPLAFPADH